MSHTITAPDLGNTRRAIAGAIALLLVALGTAAWTHSDRPAVEMAWLA